MKIFRYLVAAATALASSAASAESVPHRERAPISAVVAQLQLDTDRARQVIAILEGSRLRARTARAQIGPPGDESVRATLRTALDAIRVDTDQQLSAVLSAAELAKLKEAMPGPQRQGRAARDKQG